MVEKIKISAILSMFMFPAKNSDFFIENKKYYCATIPRKGKYNDINPEIFKEGDGVFDILDDKNVLDLTAVTKILFASNQYPDLLDNQLFVPLTLTFGEENISVVGTIVELISDKEEEKE